jgi:2-keto-3-deoxy-L-rhamnonate aldolase RhmA
MCREIKTPGLILISTGDLSVSMGLRGSYTPEVETLVQRAAAICREQGVPYGTPHATAENVEQRVKDGFSFLMSGPRRDVGTLLKGLAAAGRPAS